MIQKMQAYLANKWSQQGSGSLKEQDINFWQLRPVNWNILLESLLTAALSDQSLPSLPKPGQQKPRSIWRIPGCSKSSEIQALPSSFPPERGELNEPLFFQTPMLLNHQLDLILHLLSSTYQLAVTHSSCLLLRCASSLLRESSIV